MRKLSYLFIVVLGVFMTSCLDMIEEVFLNADGTGEYNLTIDMSGLFSDPFMKEMMMEGLKEEAGLEELEIDSLISIEDFAGNFPPTLTYDERDLLNRTEVKMRMSQSEELGMFKISFPFNSIEEITAFQGAFDKINAASEEGGAGGAAGPMGGLMGGGMTSGSNSIWSLSGRKLSREVVLPEENPLDDLDEESMGMLKMFFADATYQTIYHLPGRVRKCSIENAEIDGRTVTVSYPFLDMIEEQPNLSGDIRFRKN